MYALFASCQSSVLAPTHSRQDLRSPLEHRHLSPTSLRASNHFCLTQRADLFRLEAQLSQHFIRMLAEERRALDLRRAVAQIDGVAHRQVLAARRVINLYPRARLAQRWFVSQLFHR